MRHLFLMLVMLTASCAAGPVFSKEDFPILVGSACVGENLTWCDHVQDAITDFNDRLGLEVFAFAADTTQVVQVDFTDGAIYEDGAIARGLTSWHGDYISIQIDKYTPSTECIIQHELGHSLGLRDHINDRPNLMSAHLDCYTPDISEDGTNDYFDEFYDWFFEYFK